MANGLENILTRCPECGGKYTFVSKKNKLWCEKCGAKYEVDSRYGFIDSKPFANFAKWYDWQFEMMRKEILEDPSYELRSKVVLKHSSKDGKSQLEIAGEGICTLSRNGLTYVGSQYGNMVEKNFPLSTMYRILFGAGIDFEIYVGKEIYFFVPEEKRCCVDWYIASIVFEDIKNY